LRGDDGVGWRAAELLAEVLATTQVTVRASHQLLPEFAEEISRSDLVIFIDASCDNGPPGEIRFERVEPSRSASVAFSHELDPPALTGMARSLYGFCPSAFFFSVTGRSFEDGEDLSPEVESALPELSERVRTICGAQPSTHDDSRKPT
jgi:hydrogenase maturation protease